MNITRRKAMRVAAQGVAALFVGGVAVSSAMRLTAPRFDAAHLYVIDGLYAAMGVLDPFAERIVATAPLGQAPTNLFKAAASSRMAALDPGAGEVIVVDGESGEIARRIPLDIEPSIGALSPDGTTLAVADWVTGEMALVDLATGAARPVERVFYNVHQVQFDENGGLLFVSMIGAQEVAALDTRSGLTTPFTTAPSAHGVSHIAFFPGRAQAIAVPPPSEAAEVYVFDPSGADPVTTVALPSPATRAVASTTDRAMLLTATWDSALHRVSPAGVVETWPLPLASPVDALLPNPFQASLFAICGEDRALVEVRGDTGAVVRTVALPGAPSAALIDPLSGKLFVTFERLGVIGALDVAPGKDRGALRIIEEGVRAPYDFASSGASGVCHG